LGKVSLLIALTGIFLFNVNEKRRKFDSHENITKKSQLLSSVIFL